MVLISQKRRGGGKIVWKSVYEIVGCIKDREFRNL
jgi:hypothetical protein